MTEQDTPKMTHDEMIDALKGLVFGTFDRTTAKEREALDMAISALSENKGENRPKGEWTDWLGNGNEWECSRCKCSIESHGSIAYNFCPMCGADMRDPKDIIHKAIDNTTFAEEAYPNIKEELHKAVDMAESEVKPNDNT